MFICIYRQDQQRELELQHSNYILELQQEHGKQVGFLNHKIHELERMVNEEDNIGPGWLYLLISCEFAI